MASTQITQHRSRPCYLSFLLLLLVNINNTFLVEIQFSLFFRQFFQQQINTCPWARPAQCSEEWKYWPLPWLFISWVFHFCMPVFLFYLSLLPNPEGATGLLWKASNSIWDKLLKKGRTGKGKIISFICFLINSFPGRMQYPFCLFTTASLAPQKKGKSRC